MSTQTEARKAALFARASSATLVESVLALEALKTRTKEEGLAAIWIREELESRVAPLTSAEEEEFWNLFDAKNGVTYTAALVILRPELVA
jgi:hypothetical protein